MRKLNRIILINAAGFDYVDFPVGGHTQVIGVNGHGKSTLLRTVLFFYLGTNEKPPYALHETKADFVSYYLGTPPSYLIFEVNRADGEPGYHIAVTRPSGRIQFHFVDAPFRKDYYVDGSLVRQMESVLEQLRDARCAFDSVLSYEEFNHRLYGVSPSPYAVFRPVSRGSGQVGILPRIISGIFTVSQLDADKLKSALTCGVRQDSLSTELDLVLLKGQLEHFRRVNRAVKTYLRHENDAVALVELADQYATVKADRLHAIEELVRTAKRLPLERFDLTGQMVSLTKEREGIVEQFRIADGDLGAAIQKLGQEMAVVQSKIEQGEKVEADYLGRQIEKKRKDLESLPALREQLRLASQEYDSLTAEFTDEEQRKEKLVSEIRQGWTTLSVTFADQRTACERELRQRLETLDGERSQVLSAIEGEFREAKAALAPRQRCLEIDRTALNQAWKNLADLKEPEEMARLRKKLAEFQNQERGENHRQQELRSQIALAKSKSDHARERLENETKSETSRLEGSIKKLEEDRDGLVLNLEKLDSSLAQFFQTQAPQAWERASKTLNREALFENARQMDARISSSNDSGSVWGVEFSTDKLAPSGEHYDRESLSAKLQAVKQELAGEHDKLQAARDRYIAASSELDKQSSETRTGLESQIETSKDARRNLLDEIVRIDNQLLTLKSQADEHRQKLRKDLEQRESAFANAEQSLRHEQTQLEQRLEQRRSAAGEDFDGRKQTAGQAAKEKLESVAEMETAAAKKRDAELARIEETFQDALARKGVDPILIKAAQERMEKADSEINRISDFQTEVAEYEALKREHVELLPSLRAQKQRQEESHRSKVNERGVLGEHHQQAMSGMQERENKLNSTCEELQKDEDAVGHFRKDMRFFAEWGYFDREDLVAASFFRAGAARAFVQAAEDSHQTGMSLSQQGNANARKFLNRFDPETLDRKILGFSPIHEHFEWSIFVGTELKPFVNGRGIHAMKQIQTQEFEQLIRNICAKNADFQTGVRQVSQTADQVATHLKENNFVDVLDSIELKIDRVDSSLTRTLLRMEEFADVTFGSDHDLFGKRADRSLVDRAIETFEMLLRDIDNHKSQRLTLTDYFEFSIRVHENGHDMGWRKSLDHIGSTGTDYLVKMLIYLSLIEIYRARAIDSKMGAIVHCVLDETGVLAPKYVRSVLEYAKSRGIILITAGHSQQTAGFDNWMHVRKFGQQFAAQAVLRRVLKCD